MAGNPCSDGIALADLKHAIALYAAQAGHGSDNAVQSMAALAAIVLRDDQRATELIDGPVSQRLLVAYALAHMGGDASYDEVTGAPGPFKLDPVLSALVQAIETRGVDHVAGADRLAALAYRNGQYEVARKLADNASGPLASWVRAKLALHKGDLAAAAAAYAEAAKAFPKEGDPKASLQPSNTRLIVGEQGVLALARGEYVEAMSHLYSAASHPAGELDRPMDDDYSSPYSYRNDASYLADRVLTVDELKVFVDAHAPPSPMPAKDANENSDYVIAPLADNLRWLLARRLMRTGRYDDAQNYFPVSGDRRFGDVDLRAKAREYATALHDAGSAWTDIDKAEALYAAAVIARENGMEILAFEQAPDYLDNGGNYQGGSGHSISDLKQFFVTDGERQRFSESAAKRDWRFHYRYIAADEAVSAADLLPPRSQAFVGVLCKAAQWMRAGPPDYNDRDRYSADKIRVDAKSSAPSEAQRRVDVYYHRYVKQGAYVAWAENFGENCQTPDFERARALLKHQRIARAKHLIRRYLPYEIAGLALMLVGLGAWGSRRRRRKATA